MYGGNPSPTICENIYKDEERGEHEDRSFSLENLRSEKNEHANRKVDKFSRELRGKIKPAARQFGNAEQDDYAKADLEDPKSLGEAEERMLIHAEFC